MKAKLKELAARLPPVNVQGVKINHYSNLRKVYKASGKQGVIDYCAPFMLRGALDTLQKESASVWKRHLVTNS